MTDPLCSWREAATICAAGVAAGLAGAVLGVAVMVCGWGNRCR
jgi:hypothetical protein